MSHRTGVSTFASRTSPTQSLQKGFHLSHPSENKKIRNRTNQHDTKMTVNINIDFFNLWQSSLNRFN